jgi:hypothetical protein
VHPPPLHTHPPSLLPPPPAPLPSPRPKRSYTPISPTPLHPSTQRTRTPLIQVAENQLFAPAFLGELLIPKYDYSAAVVVVTGAIITTIFGPKEAAVTTALHNAANCSSPEAKAAEAAALANGSAQVAKYAESKVYFERLFEEPIFIGYETTAIFLFVVSCVFMKFEPKWADKYLFLFYSYVAGTLGGQQNMFLKGVASLLGIAFGGAGSEVFGDWMVWVFIIGMLILAPSQLAVINGESPCAERAKRGGEEEAGTAVRNVHV